MRSTKPSNFKEFPWASALQNAESERVALNIMIILSRTGDEFRLLGFEEYKEERLKDGGYNDIEKSYFEDVVEYCTSPEAASRFSKTWLEIYKNNL